MSPSDNIDRNEIIGERVRFYRTTRHLSLDKLSRSLQVPITGAQLARYETAQSRMPADLLIDIALTLGLDIRLLTGLEDGKHEGKTNGEWEAERYKVMILNLPEKARKVIFHIIGDIASIF